MSEQMIKVLKSIQFGEDIYTRPTALICAELVALGFAEMLATESRFKGRAALFRCVATPLGLERLEEEEYQSL